MTIVLSILYHEYDFKNWCFCDREEKANQHGTFHTPLIF